MGRRCWPDAKPVERMGRTRAVIDIGTNSVKLLVAEVDGNAVTRLFENSEQTRLGQGFYETSRLLPEAIEATAKAVRQWREKAAMFSPERIEVVATSAARAQQNNVSTNVHSSGANIAFIDVHVSYFKAADYWDFAKKEGRTNNPHLVWKPWP